MKKKALLAVSLAAIMATGICLSLTACGGGEGGNETDGTQVTQEEWAAAFEESNFDNIKITGMSYMKRSSGDETYNMTTEYELICVGKSYSFEICYLDDEGNSYGRNQSICVEVADGMAYYKREFDENGKAEEWEKSEKEEFEATYGIVKDACILNLMSISTLYSQAEYDNNEKVYTVRETSGTVEYDMTVKFKNGKVSSMKNSTKMASIQAVGAFEYEYGGQKVEAPVLTDSE